MPPSPALRTALLVATDSNICFLVRSIDHNHPGPTQPTAPHPTSLHPTLPCCIPHTASGNAHTVHATGCIPLVAHLTGHTAHRSAQRAARRKLQLSQTHPIKWHPITGHPITGHPITWHPITWHPITWHPITWQQMAAIFSISLRRNPPHRIGGMLLYNGIGGGGGGGRISTGISRLWRWQLGGGCAYATLPSGNSLALDPPNRRRREPAYRRCVQLVGS